MRAVGAMRPITGSGRVIALAGLAVVALAAASTVAVAAATGAFSDHRGAPTATRCSVPALPGAVVSVRVVDMCSMMGRTPMMGGHGPLMSERDWRRFRPGMMRVLATPTSVAHGAVSLRVTNDGYLTHELVVLPLPAGQPAGARIPAADGKVSEAGSAGEASASCADGAGDGIVPGATGWVTLRLPAGRYELVCNLPGHYAAGMHTELDLT